MASAEAQRPVTAHNRPFNAPQVKNQVKVFLAPVAIKLSRWSWLIEGGFGKRYGVEDVVSSRCVRPGVGTRSSSSSVR